MECIKVRKKCFINNISAENNVVVLNDVLLSCLGYLKTNPNDRQKLNEYETLKSSVRKAQEEIHKNVVPETKIETTKYCVKLILFDAILLSRGISIKIRKD